MAERQKEPRPTVNFGRIMEDYCMLEIEGVQPRRVGPPGYESRGGEDVTGQMWANANRNIVMEAMRKSPAEARIYPKVRWKWYSIDPMFTEAGTDSWVTFAKLVLEIAERVYPTICREID